MKGEAIEFDALAPGTRARVLRYGAMEEDYRNRLLSMGLVPGTEFELLRRAPLGDPVEIAVRGFRLSLRRAEAAAMQVERL